MCVTSSSTLQYGASLYCRTRRMSQLRNCWDVLPPLVEQHRIVAKVDELMALCDRLEASIARADDIRRRLLDALLYEAFAPRQAYELEAAE